MSADNILTCQGGTLSTGGSGEPLCVGGIWELEGNSAFWDLALTTDDIATLLARVAFIFALVWCFRLLLRVIQNNRG